MVSLSFLWIGCVDADLCRLAGFDDVEVSEDMSHQNRVSGSYKAYIFYL